MFIEKALQDALYQIGVEVANEARKVAPYQTGNLYRDIGIFTTKLPIGIVEVGNTQTAPYAPYVFYGVEPMTRISKSGKRYHHKGQKANPYLLKGLESTLRGDSIEKILEQNGLEEAIIKDLNLDNLGEIK